jgi:hypothetical protein
VFAAQHLLGFRGIDLLLERLEGAREIGHDLFPALRPFEQHAEVVDLLGEAVAQLDVFRETALPLQGLLSLGLVVPEIGPGDLPFELR